MICGQESDYGCHGVGVNEYYCEKHWLAKKNGQRMQTKKEQARKMAEFQAQMAPEPVEIDWALIPAALRKKLGK